MTVTFETKCYENDWEILLKTRRLQAMIERHHYPFARRILYINNVRDPVVVCRRADILVAKSIIDSYIVVADHAEAALAHFQTDRDSFQGGYYYSIQELVGIYLCQTDYLLHYSSDAILHKDKDWVTPALSLLKANPAVKVVNPVWNNKHAEARSESFQEDDDYYYGYGFSDQCYLVRAAEFQQLIYNERHPASERYPVRAGQLFEKRVDSWMRNNRHWRATTKHASYIHRNFPQSKLKKKLGIIWGLYDE